MRRRPSSCLSLIAEQADSRTSPDTTDLTQTCFCGCAAESFGPTGPNDHRFWPDSDFDAQLISATSDVARGGSGCVSWWLGRGLGRGAGGLGCVFWWLAGGSDVARKGLRVARAGGWLISALFCDLCEETAAFNEPRRFCDLCRENMAFTRPQRFFCCVDARWTTFYNGGDPRHYCGRPLFYSRRPQETQV